jgi:hypothetical protein
VVVHGLKWTYAVQAPRRNPSNPRLRCSARREFGLRVASRYATWGQTIPCRIARMITHTGALRARSSDPMHAMKMMCPAIRIE